MEFREQIKTLRIKNNLTQEQFGTRLNVTRQAVSNWENDRNLPDLEMLILIADVFHLSLDELILGGTHVNNNLTEKLIKDGSTTRRAKLNLITTAIGASLLLLGLALLFIKAHSVEYIDAAGFLHENFYLLPIGMLFLLAGIITISATGVSYVVTLFRKKS